MEQKVPKIRKSDLLNNLEKVAKVYGIAIQNAMCKKMKHSHLHYGLLSSECMPLRPDDLQAPPMDSKSSLEKSARVQGS